MVDSSSRAIMEVYLTMTAVGKQRTDGPASIDEMIVELKQMADDSVQRYALVEEIRNHTRRLFDKIKDSSAGQLKTSDEVLPIPLQSSRDHIISMLSSIEGVFDDLKSKQTAVLPDAERNSPQDPLDLHVDKPRVVQCGQTDNLSSTAIEEQTALASMLVDVYNELSTSDGLDASSIDHSHAGIVSIIEKIKDKISILCKQSNPHQSTAAATSDKVPIQPQASTESHALAEVQLKANMLCLSTGINSPEGSHSTLESLFASIKQRITSMMPITQGTIQIIDSIRRKLDIEEENATSATEIIDGELLAYYLTLINEKLEEISSSSQKGHTVMQGVEKTDDIKTLKLENEWKSREMSQAHEKEKSRLKEELQSLMGAEQLLKEKVERLEGELRQARERLQTSEKQDKELYSKTHQLAFRSLGQIGKGPPKDAPTDHRILASLSERVVSLLESSISTLKKDLDEKTSEVTRQQKEIEALKKSEAPVEPKGFKPEAVIKLATVCKRICSQGEAAEISPAEDLELLALATESTVNRLIEEQRSQKEVADNHQTQLRESAERVAGLQKRVEEQDKLLSDHKTGMETLLSEVQSLCGMANIEVDFKPVAQKALNNPGVLAPLVKSVCETVLQLNTSNSKEKEQVEQKISVIHNLLEPQQGSVNSARKNIDDRLEFIQTAVSQLTKSQTENQDAKKDKTLSNQQSPDLIAHADGMVYGLAIIEEIAKLLPNFNIDQDQLRKADRTTVDSKIIEIIQALNEMSQAHEKEKSRLKEELQKLKGAEQLLKEQVQKLKEELRQARERLQTSESAVNRLIEEQRSQKEVAVNHQTQLRESAERVDELQKRVEEQDKLLSDHKTGMETLLSEVQSLCGMANIEVDFKPVAQKALNNPGVLAPLVKSASETVLQLKTSNSKEKEQVEQRLSSSDDQSPNSNAQQLKELMQLIELHSKRIEGDEHFSGSHQDRLNNLIGSLEQRYQEYLKSTFEKIYSSSVFFCRGLIGVVEWVEHEELRYRLSNFLEDLLSSIVKNRSTELCHIVSLSEADQNSSTKSTHWSNIEHAFFAQANELGS